ncbi:MAG: gamma-butyrobetaine hydroxylase-like domain-containing protein [Bryobacteraceae bacterium]
MQSELETMAPQAEPEHIAISKSSGIKIDWRDGHHSDYSLAYLRDECPCATCTGAHGTEPQKSNYSKPDAFPMFKPALKMTSVEAVGSYAVRIFWNDGHSSGIYSFDHLRHICNCEQCKNRNSSSRP